MKKVVSRFPAGVHDSLGRRAFCESSDQYAILVDVIICTSSTSYYRSNNVWRSLLMKTRKSFNDVPDFESDFSGQIGESREFRFFVDSGDRLAPDFIIRVWEEQFYQGFDDSEAEG